MNFNLFNKSCLFAILFVIQLKITPIYGNSISRESQIQNLNEHLEIFTSCLVHIINYKVLDLDALPIPTVLSRYTVPYIPSLRTDRDIPDIKIAIFGLENTTNVHHYLEGIDLSTKVKPWLCEAHIFLDPPPYYKWEPDYFRSRTRPRINLEVPKGLSDFWIIATDIDANPIISTRPKYSVMVVNEAEPIVIPSYFSFQVKRATSVQLVIRMELIETGEPNTKAIRKVLLLSKNAGNAKQCGLFNTIELQWNTLKLSDLMRISVSLSVTEGTAWKIVGQQAFANYIKEFKYFGSLPESMAYNLLVEHPHDPYDFYQSIQVSLIGSVLRNVTFLLSDVFNPFELWDSSGELRYILNCKYEQGDLPSLHAGAGGINKLPAFHYVFYSLDFRFVACGKLQAGKNLPFHELVSAFDEITWVFVSLSVFGVYVVLLLIQLYGSPLPEYFNWIDSIAVVLCPILEKPSCLEPKMNALLAYRFLMCFYLLSAFLLSNFYRGDNINELTAPIPEVPIDQFAQLVENDIEVFAMPEKHPYIFINEERKQKNDRNISEYFNHTKAPNYVSNLLFYLSVFHSIRFQIPVQAILKTKLSQVQQLYLNHSKLPSKTEQFYALADNSNNPGKEHLNAVLGTLVHTCINKTIAAIMSESMAYLMWSGHKGFGISNVYVGKDVLVEIFMGYRLLNDINYKILQRFDGLFSSGIVGWWRDLPKDFMIRYGYRMGSRQELVDGQTQTNMKGAIVVIFMLLPVGFLISIVSFILEIIRNSREFKKNHVVTLKAKLSLSRDNIVCNECE
ncbi:unnamed protein product [Orchesella dallaii]|uniref:Uncharacterized protein n=1 Tax=Orchesella dallaii TaxID=48710 RepID=A0ABP1PYG8_9HEXA